MRLNGAKIILECLLEHGVNTVFGYPGGSVLDLYDALYDYQNKITHIITAHEQGACHAADGYARAYGGVGVVFATSGPGATNLVTGIANAYMDSIPLVAITGNVPLSLLGRDSFQEVDITGITMPITKQNYIVKDINELADIVREAFFLASSGRKGPVLIDVPKNIFNEICEYKKSVPQASTFLLPVDLKNAAEIIMRSTRPLIFMGGGIIASEAYKEITAFAEKTNAPVTCSLMGLSGFDASHPLYMGLLGMHGHLACNLALKECDLLIAVGTRFSDRVATNRDSFARNKEIIHIDIDNAEINKNITPTTYLLGDCKAVLSHLTEKIAKKSNSEWQSRILQLKISENEKACDTTINPKDVLAEIAMQTPKDQVIVTDVGQHQMWVAQSYPFNKPRTFITSGGLGAMGFGLGASIGACIKTGKKTFLITGDGSFHMNMNEFATCVKNNLPIVVVVMNNHVLGMVRQLQKIFCKSHFSQTSINHKTNYKALAEAFGGIGMDILKSSDIKTVIAAAIKEQKPVIINVELSQNEGVFPMIPTGKSVDDVIMEIEEDSV